LDHGILRWLRHPSRSPTFPYAERVFVDAEIPVRYFDTGERERPALIFVHGLGANLTNFEHVAPPFHANGWRVAGLDLPGFGLSGKPHRDYTIAGFASHLDGFLDHLGAPHAVIVGHSLGGLVAADFAMRAPERVSALILISPAGLFRVPAPLRVVGRAVWRSVFLRPALRLSARQLLERVFHKENARTRAFFDASTHPDTTGRFLDELSRVMGAARRDLVSRHLLDDAERLTTPTLILWGEHDRLLPFSQVPGFAARLPRGQLEVIPNCGHMSIVEEPESVVARASAFLQRCSLSLSREAL
jgi:pimeloyl-ACP methyl ester carboxylesterase